MQLWRISNYAILSGEGGLSFEGRWHEIGLPIVYLAGSPPGALLEVLVHLEVEETPPPESYQLLEIDAPDTLAIEDLVPEQKDGEPCLLSLTLTRLRGSDWLRSRRCALARVPSAVLPSTWNYLLNPTHPDAALVRILKVHSAKHDRRLFREMRG